MSEYVVMPKSDYVSACDTIREKTGSTEPIKSNELIEKINQLGTAKEEQEKVVTITENGTTVILPDENKTLSKVTVDVDVPSSDLYYDDFWDVFQQNGERTDYSFGFYSPLLNMNLWTDRNFIPKYDMYPTNMQVMFNYTDLQDIKGIFERLGRIFDTSKCTNFVQTFRRSKVIYPPTLDLSSASVLNGTFLDCSKMIAVHLKNVHTNVTFGGAFTGCTALTDVVIEGTIGSAVSFANSPLLSTESVDNIAGCLADLTGQTAQTITLHADVKSKLSDEQIASITAKNWTLA